MTTFPTVRTTEHVTFTGAALVSSQVRLTWKTSQGHRGVMTVDPDALKITPGEGGSLTVRRYGPGWRTVSGHASAQVRRALAEARRAAHLLNRPALIAVRRTADHLIFEGRTPAGRVVRAELKRPVQAQPVFRLDRHEAAFSLSFYEGEAGTPPVTLHSFTVHADTPEGRAALEDLGLGDLLAEFDRFISAA